MSLAPVLRCSMAAAALAIIGKSRMHALRKISIAILIS